MPVDKSVYDLSNFGDPDSTTLKPEETKPTSDFDLSNFGPPPDPIDVIEADNKKESDYSKGRILRNLLNSGTEAMMADPAGRAMNVPKEGYIQQAGYNNSLIGLTSEIISGEKRFDTSKYGDPNVAQEIGAIAVGFMLDAPFFGGLGKLGEIGTKAVVGAFKPAAKSVVEKASSKLVKTFVKSGVSEDMAEQMVKAGASKNANIIRRLTQVGEGVEKVAPALGSSATALGGYNALHDALYQMAEDDRPISEINWGEVRKEGMIGVKMGAALGALGFGGKYLESITKIPEANQLIQRAITGGVKAGELGAEVSLFAAGDAYLRDEEIDKEKWLNAMKMVAGGKIAGFAQGSFIKKSEAFDPEKPYEAFDPNLSDVEKDLLEKYRPENKVGDIDKVIKKDQLIDISQDEKIPLITKMKLLYNKTGYYPTYMPAIEKIDVNSKRGDHTISVYDKDGQLLDVRKFTNKQEAERVAKQFVDETEDFQRRRAWAGMSWDWRRVIMDGLLDKGIDLQKTSDAWDIRPEFRTADEAKAVRKFYSTWDELIAPKEPETKTEIKSQEPAVASPEVRKEAPKSEAGEVQGGVEYRKGEGWKVSDKYTEGAKTIKTIEDVDQNVKETQDLLKKVKAEKVKKESIDNKRSSDTKNAKYRILDQIYKNKDDFLDALEKLPYQSITDLVNDLSYPMKIQPEVEKAMEVGKARGKVSLEEKLPFQSKEELGLIEETLNKRIERFEDVRGKILESADTPEIKQEKESLLAAAHNAVKTVSIDPINKSIMKGKKMTTEQNKKIRSLLNGFFTSNYRRFNRLRIPISTRVLRDINNIPIGKRGWVHVGNIIKDLTRMMNDKEYRDKVRQSEAYVQRILKETDYNKLTTAKSGPVRKSRKAKRNYYAAGEGADRIEQLKNINNLVRLGIEDQQFAEKSYEDVKKIMERAKDRLVKLETGEDLDVPKEDIDAYGFTGDDLANLEALEFVQVGGMREPSDIKRLLDKVKEIKKEGRTKSAEARAKWKEQREERVANVVKTVLPKGKEIKRGPEATRKKKKWFDYLEDMSLKSLYNSLGSKRELASGEKTGIFDNYLHKEFQTRVSRSEEGEAGDRHTTSVDKRTAMEIIFGLNGIPRWQRGAILRNKVLDMAVALDYTPITYVNDKGVTKNMKISQLQALHLWLTAQQEGARETFMKPMDEGGMGWTKESFDQLDKFLTPEAKELGQWMRDYIGDFVYNKGVNDVYRQESGVSLARIENYWPFIRQVDEFNKSVTDINDRTKFRDRVTSDFHIERVKNTNPFVYADALDVFDKYMDEMTKYKNWAETVRILDETFKDRRVRDAIDQYHGHKYNDLHDWFIRRFAGHEPTESWAGLDRYIRRLSKGILYFNRAVGIKQSISSMMYLLDMDMAHWGEGMVRMMTTREGHELARYLRRQPFLVDRGTAPLDLDTNIRRTAKDYENTENWLKRNTQRFRYNIQRMLNVLPKETAEQILGANIKYMDRFPIVTAGGGYMMDLMRRDGTSWKKMKAKARKRAVDNHTEYSTELDNLMRPYANKWTAMSEATQQSTRISNISRGRAGASWKRAVTMFTSGAGQIHRISTSALRNAVNSFKQGNMADGLRHTKNFMLAHAIMGAAFNLVGNGLLVDVSGQNESKWRNKTVWGIMLGNMRGIAWWGRIVSFLSDVVMNEPWAESSTFTPMLDNLKNIALELNRVYEANRAGDTNRRNKHLFKLSESLGQWFGIQVKQAFKLYDDAKEVYNGESERPVRQGLGIYDPDFNSGVELVDVFDPEAWTEAQREEAAMESAKIQGGTGRQGRRILKENEK